MTLKEVMPLFVAGCDIKGSNAAVCYVADTQGVRKPSVVDVVIRAFVYILHSPRVTAFIAGLKEHMLLACPLMRILMLNEVSAN